MTKAIRQGRIEDRRLITGKGRYADDITETAALTVVFMRAPMASARVLSLDTSTAKGMPGVVAVLTAQDLADDGIGPVQTPMKLAGPDERVWEATPRPLLVSDRVRHVGEPMAMVIAETRAQAMDAAEAIEAEMDELAAVIDVAEATANGAPLVHEDRPGNLGAEWERGDWAAVRAAIDAAPHRVLAQVPVSRVTAMTMEPRTALARPEGAGKFALFASHQNPVAMRAALAQFLNMEPEAIRCVAGDVGGAFGMKSGPLREETLVFWAARYLNRALRWRADRSEGFLTDEAGRDMAIEVELGLDNDGTILAQAVTARLNIGAYATARSLPPVLNFGGVAGVYRTPLIAGRMRAYLTHTVPVAPYRGAGRPEATYAIEMALDIAARQIGMDRIELRRRNLIQPAEMPWKSKFIFDYDSGDFPRLLDHGLKLADAAGYPARKAASEAAGKLRGFGLAMCIETAGGLWGSPGRDFADVSINADGSVTLGGGGFSAGQGLETTLSDIAAEGLDLPVDQVAYYQGDTDRMQRGGGMGGSGGTIKVGSAVRDAVEKVLAQAKDLASDSLEADAADIEYEAGVFRIAGTDRELALAEIARTAIDRGTPLLGKGEFVTDGPTFPNGCHICEVELDPETGQVRIDSYTGVEDIGRVMQPQIASGQIQGGVAQALGQIFMEEMRYAPGDGQLLTGSLMDYALPRAGDLPALVTGFSNVPTTKNPLGVKGVGEAGSVGGLAAGMSAVCDALAQAGVDSFDMPASPGRVWSALQMVSEG
ncbi:xanthine dehydrogenase family protein molybdopterin-binding subunit [Pseudooceanicola sp.]|uniref:xanthine dehydrogenase family protein molybdopterin-binding subunit n=1 Tax=Pseudooceanicola sp. TaxID=1914328 RepID=UPI002620DB74|nr:xanthine dehydrogenase family protein molybdopterin-binding subunit [Pseudooceanicola sp.]MDF1854627.1 xanthine dehydrogenase family protein molybdopterin-binding subunit [Pseudooceanicola sp.]